MTAKASGPGFLDLPISIREKIYAYLLLPYLEEDVTTINYTLHWPYLDNPSNTTFAGPTQLDPCTCPRADLKHEGQHIYTRYKCVGPEVQFKSPGEGLWVLQAAHGQFNILRPALDTELNERPSVTILQTSKQIHGEALPYLYHERDFFFVTGPCPRGRYQAYATLQWLKQLSERARANVEILSLLVQPYEEDCSTVDVERSYAELGAYIRDQLPGFKWLCLDVWDPSVYIAASVFLRLFDREGRGIVVRQPWKNGEAEVFVSKEIFLNSFEEVEE
ncbi:hypothetical protein C7974DRAFT_389490 [Boeremia exigua]|uniref:uncharacterized protein n=1 Tax=Boeremia exigua TaxID=749465 RepID=UPI001E8DA503|nr:uncharacterized protein C7974DRAFT_389490 [Boeremia exigua]KAH6637422.1 hypothetical protein C7974DRAFT_389490 [Boeremia exigua]